jgi:hypothetical protein
MTTFTKVMWSGAALMAAVVLSLWGAAGSTAKAPSHHLGYARIGCAKGSPAGSQSCVRPLPYPYRGAD